MGGFQIVIDLMRGFILFSTLALKTIIYTRCHPTLLDYKSSKFSLSFDKLS